MSIFIIWEWIDAAKVQKLLPKRSLASLKMLQIIPIAFLGTIVAMTEEEGQGGAKKACTPLRHPK